MGITAIQVIVSIVFIVLHGPWGVVEAVSFNQQVDQFVAFVSTACPIATTIIDVVNGAYLKIYQLIPVFLKVILNVLPAKIKPSEKTIESICDKAEKFVKKVD